MRDLDPRDLFVWLGKIFYGMLYRDLFLPFDRSGRRGGSIATTGLLAMYRAHHLFLQSVRVPMVFAGFSPASILVVNTQEPTEPSLGWDFRDDLATMFIGCRVGKVGMIAALQDGGAQREELFPLLGVERLQLHPLQFVELMAHVLYKARLLNRTPKYLTVDGEPMTVVQVPLQGFSRRPVFGEWDPAGYAHVLAEMTGLGLDDVFHPPDAVITWLRNEDGAVRGMPLDEYPM